MDKKIVENSLSETLMSIVLLSLQFLLKLYSKLLNIGQILDKYKRIFINSHLPDFSKKKFIHIFFPIRFSENLNFRAKALKGFLHRKLTFDMLQSTKKYEKIYYILCGVKMFQTKDINI